MIKEDGTEEWIYESLDNSKCYPSPLYSDLDSTKNKSDNRVFWFSNYVTPLIWVALMIVSIFKFSIQNVTICLFGFSLAMTNLTGYQKCEKNHKNKLKGFIMSQAKDKLSAEQMAKIGQTVIKYQASGSNQ